jgi:anti-sigma factor RsiW
MIASEAYVHAYVDGELAEHEFDTVATEILNSDEHFADACDLQMLKHLVRQAYSSIPFPDQV